MQRNMMVPLAEHELVAERRPCHAVLVLGFQFGRAYLIGVESRLRGTQLTCS